MNKEFFLIVDSNSSWGWGTERGPSSPRGPSHQGGGEGGPGGWGSPGTWGKVQGAKGGGGAGEEAWIRGKGHVGERW